MEEYGKRAAKAALFPYCVSPVKRIFRRLAARADDFSDKVDKKPEI